MAEDNDTPEDIDSEAGELEAAELPPEEEVEEAGEEEPLPKKDKPEECPPCEVGAPAWMATFADMATLLMAFFVLILSFASVNVPKFEQVAGSIKLAFGVNRVVPRVSIPMAETVISSEYTPSEAAPTVMPTPTQAVTDPTRENVKQMKGQEEAPYDVQADYMEVIEAMENEIETGQVEVRVENNEIVVELRADTSTDRPGQEGMGAGGRLSQETLEVARAVTDLQREIASNIVVKRQNDGQLNAEGNESEASSKYEQIRAALSQQINQGLAEVERDGDSIIIRLGQQDSFTSGSANLRSSFTATLEDVGNAVSNTGGVVRVEGHTDSIPVAFNDRYRSNWDLSSARSAAVANYLLDNTGLQPGRVTITGLADSVPIADNATPEGRARNRRIEVIVDG